MAHATTMRIVKRLHQGRACTVSRAQLAGRDEPVIIKQLHRQRCSPEQLSRLAHEYEILRPLDIAGVIRPLEMLELDSGPAIVFADHGGRSLRHLIISGDQDWPDWLAIMARVAEALGRLHEARITHKQISPDHIVINPESGEPQLIDFSLSTRLSREQASWNTPQLATHTLPYIAPEQTGRINRAIDYRTDYYSFGATLYELLTGHPPFSGEEPLELVHCHIARQPVAPHRVNRTLPPMVSDIVLKLLAKDAAQRYQSAGGLVHDLNQCLDQWQRHRRVDRFMIGMRDVSARFQVPQKLYGREAMLEQLTANYNLCAAGGQALVLISGYTGVGKSSLVHELRQYINEHEGRFSSGKFDQFRRNRPYFAILQALQGLVRQLLAEPEERVTAWRTRLHAELGNSMSALLKLIPELGPIVGDGSRAPDHAPLDEQGRFRVFAQLLGVFAQRESPLVLFFDDLQWADLASLQLLEALAHTPCLPHLLLIGSYRDHALHAGHPLPPTLQRLRESPLEMHEYRLEPLTPLQVGRLVAETLRCDERECRQLALVCHEKTQGNPFFLNQFLSALYEEGLIHFRDQRWQWDETAIRSREMTDDVVSLMVGKIQRLPPRTQKVLPLAACIGATFNLRTLSVAHQSSPRETAEDLWPALTEGLVAPVDDSYRLFQHFDATRTRYRFVHDRIQQAAYSLIDEAELEALHLLIGRLLRQSLAPDEVGARIFEITNHLNLARGRITDRAERLDLAALNLEAGTRARESAAFDTALDYLQTGLALLPDDCWATSYALTRDLHIAAAETANIKADFELMERLARAVEAHAHSLLEKVRVHEIRIQSQVSRNRFGEGLAIALEVLGLLGVSLPREPSRLQIWLELIRTQWLLRDVSAERILAAPQIRDPHTLAALSILASMFGIVKFSSSALRPLVMARQVELTVRHGLTDAAAPAFAGYGGVLCGRFDAIDEGYRLGRVGLELAEQRPAGKGRHKTLSLFNSYVRHYKEPLRHSLEPLRQAHQMALDCGDMEYAAYSLAAHIQYAFPLAGDIAELQSQLEKQAAQLRQMGQRQSLQYSIMTLQTIANLRGQNRDPLRLDGEFYDEDAKLAEHRSENHRTAICLHHFYKALLAFIFGDFRRARDESSRGIAYLTYVAGTFTVAWFRGLDALCRLASVRDGGFIARRIGLLEVHRSLRRMRHWARHCPENHEHRLMLLTAEWLRVRGRHARAIDFYDRAIELADRHGFVLEAAIACELAARFYLEWAKPGVARAYLSETWRRYQRWGATEKLAHMSRSYELGPDGLQDLLPPAAAPSHAVLEDALLSNQAFDIASVIQASQAISDEIVLERLLDRLMHLALANAGAQRGMMVMSRHNQLFIEAEAALEQPPRLFPSLPLDKGGDDLPVSVVNYVARTREPVVLGDATGQQMFAQDGYIRARRPRSVLCIPILYHGELTAVLYLEHFESRDVFDRHRLKTLQILAAQAAISIENAKLYLSLQQSEREYRSLFENAVEGIFRVSPSGRFISANPALVRMLGYHGPEAFLSSVTDVTSQCFIDHDDLRRFLGKLNMNERVLNFETRWHRLGGEPIFVSISARRVLDQDGKLLYYEGSLTDISERKAKEHAELAREKAEAASEAKSQFLATMSHEIRTPLNGILGMAQLLMRGPLSAEQRARVQAIDESGRTLLSILNDVLDFMKIEAGQMQLEQRVFSPAGAIDALRPMLESIAHEKGLDLIVRLESGLPQTVVGDRRALNQVMLNLATNALKFTTDGYVALRARVIESLADFARLRFEVEDSGIGIAAEAQARIFDHFCQADSSITRRFGGTGLGLAICRRLVELQGGQIGVSSTPGAGSLFWFEIDYRLDASGSRPAPPPNCANTPVRPLEILLVEDTAINQQVTQGLLESDGHAVAIADDGYTALSMHNDHDYDVVLMDIHLPGMDGIETSRRMRSHPDPHKARVRIIALTASVTPHEVESYLDAGIDAVVGKPIQFSDLQRLLTGLSAAAANPATHAGERDGLLDGALLDQHRQLLGAQRFGTLIGALPGQCTGLLAELTQSADTRARRELLHKLAGTCANFGLSAAARLCRELEAAGEDVTDLDSRFDALGAVVADSLAALGARYPDLVATAAPGSQADTVSPA
jgi:PAS domain S-box-containing protein